MLTDLSRRKFLRSAGLALALIPIVIARSAHAMSNAQVRARLQYQNTPKNDMSCSSCLEFVPGKTDKDSGRCKIIPDDDEITPNGYCTGWNSM